MTHTLASPLIISEWLNTSRAISLNSLKGKVVLLEAFQMLCPACVSHSLPQAMRVRKLFNQDDVAVIGLHSVFEHHKAQGHRAALAAFLLEYRISFPVGIDALAQQAGLPQTMAAYGLRGTPTTILIDRNGFLRQHKFGREEDLALGAQIMSLLREPVCPATRGEDKADIEICDQNGCVIPAA